MMKFAPLCVGGNGRMAHYSRFQGPIAIYTDTSAVGVQPLLIAAGTKSFLSAWTS